MNTDISRADISRAVVAPTPDSFKAGMRMVYDQAVAFLRAAQPTVVDGDTGEITERRFEVVFREVVLDRSLAQNRFYWGVVLKQVAAQAPGGWTADAWHEAFRRTELGYEQHKVRVAGKKRPTIIRRLRSTTDLSVKQFSEYLERVMAAAAQAYGVVFDIDPAEYAQVKYTRPARKAKATTSPAREAVEA